jgi:hypothetical protein
MQEAVRQGAQRVVDAAALGGVHGDWRLEIG